MERLYRDPSSSLPLIDFMPEGNLKIEGRSILEDATGFFKPLIDFVKYLEIPRPGILKTFDEIRG